MRKKLFVILPCLVLLAGILAYAFRFQLHFPMWERAEEMEPVQGVQIEFVSMETTFYEGRAMPEYLDVHATVSNEAEISGTLLSYWVDYEHGGTWYTVYRKPPMEIASAAAIFLDPGRHSIRVRVPEKVFRWPGEYRIYMQGWGYCPIHID